MLRICRSLLGVDFTMVSTDSNGEIVGLNAYLASVNAKIMMLNADQNGSNA